MFALNWHCAISFLINSLEGNRYVFHCSAVFENYAAEEAALHSSQPTRLVILNVIWHQRHHGTLSDSVLTAP
jgi:hypothetical protein